MDYLNKNYKANGRNEDFLRQRINKIKKDLEDMYNGKFSKDVKLNVLSLVRKKDQVMKSMINAIDKSTDIDLQNNDFKKLLEARKKLKSFEEKDKIYKAEFDIRIYMKMLYDQEIYLIKFREYALDNPSPDQILTSGDISEKQTINKNKLDKKRFMDETFKNTLNLTNKSLKSVSVERSKTNSSILKREKMIKSINENRKLHYYNFINIIITSLLCIMLVVYIIILVYQNTMIVTSHIIFLFLSRKFPLKKL